MLLASCTRALSAAASVGASSAAPLRASSRASACHQPTRSLFVRLRGSPTATLERLQAKSGREGIEKELAKRKEYIKPTLQRQKDARDSRFNAAKRVRQQLVEELLLDKKLTPFD